MLIVVRHVDGNVPVTVLQPHGDIDGANYMELVEQTEEVFAKGTRHVVLDLIECSYMSSAGLVAVQRMIRTLRGEAKTGQDESGWDAMREIDRERDSGFQDCLKLLNLNTELQLIFQRTGLDQYLETFDDLDQAVASF